MWKKTCKICLLNTKFFIHSLTQEVDDTDNDEAEQT